MGVAVVIDLLNHEGINPDRTDPDGRSVLSWVPLIVAATKKHIGVVMRLLGTTGVNPDIVDFYSEPALFCAAKGGHVEALRLLVEQEEVILGQSNHQGRTPLAAAAMNGIGAKTSPLRLMDWNTSLPPLAPMSLGSC